MAKLRYFLKKVKKTPYTKSGTMVPFPMVRDALWLGRDDQLFYSDKNGDVRFATNDDMKRWLVNFLKGSK